MILLLSNSKHQVDLALYHWDLYHRITGNQAQESWLASSTTGMQERALSLSGIMVLLGMTIYEKIIHRWIRLIFLLFDTFIEYLKAICWTYFYQSSIPFSNLQFMTSLIFLLNLILPISMCFQRIYFFCKYLLGLRVYPIFKDHYVWFFFWGYPLWSY